MKEKTYGVITFESVNHALKAETIFNKEDIGFRTIPTPREISHSCGIAIRFDLKDKDLAKNIIKDKNLNIKAMFKFTKDNGTRKAEEIN